VKDQLLGGSGAQRAGIALEDEGAPVVGIGMPSADGLLRVAQRLRIRFGSLFDAQDALLEIDHQFLGLLIGHLPQAHHQRARPGHGERPAQAEDALADMDLAQAGFAGAEHDQLGVQ